MEKVGSKVGSTQATQSKHAEFWGNVAMLERSVAELEDLAATIAGQPQPPTKATTDTKEGTPSLSEFLLSGSTRVGVLTERITKVRADIEKNLF